NYFIVKEVMVNTMYALDLKAMAKLCHYVSDPDELKYEALSKQVTGRIMELMYDRETVAFYDVYGHQNKQSKVLTFTIALPLLLNETDDATAATLISRHFLNESEFALPFPIPSTAKSEAAFSPSESKFLWRGPTWMLT